MRDAGVGSRGKQITPLEGLANTYPAPAAKSGKPQMYPAQKAFVRAARAVQILHQRMDRGIGRIAEREAEGERSRDP